MKKKLNLSFRFDLLKKLFIFMFDLFNFDIFFFIKHLSKHVTS